jgi:hypothetical protein
MIEICPRYSCRRKTVEVSDDTHVIQLASYCSKGQRHIDGDEHADRSVATFVEKLNLIRDDILQVVDLTDELVQLSGEIRKIFNTPFGI